MGEITTAIMATAGAKVRVSETPIGNILTTCEFCGEGFSFLRGEGEQVVLRVEGHQDYDGDLAMACNGCSQRYKMGEIHYTHKEHGDRPGNFERVVLLSEIFEVSDRDPLFGVFLLGKQKFGEGRRWVESDRVREQNKKIKKDFEEAFLKAHGVTYKEWSSQQQRKSLIDSGRRLKERGGHEVDLRFL
jgi:hypothetical protein